MKIKAVFFYFFCFFSVIIFISETGKSPEKTYFLNVEMGGRP